MTESQPDYTCQTSANGHVFSSTTFFEIENTENIQCRVNFVSRALVTIMHILSRYAIGQTFYIRYKKGPLKIIQ